MHYGFACGSVNMRIVVKCTTHIDHSNCVCVSVVSGAGSDLSVSLSMCPFDLWDSSMA